ncbi:transporter substrate-binding domain-containing protein [Rhodoferax sp. GW822-FHT02A01]|uniref:substrate-binding periplasmic protein n=1 Tax=Rhodoferax sp. GW822-FHT02A01 TaxID=3141537 RepID=UPI00315CEF67
MNMRSLLILSLALLTEGAGANEPVILSTVAQVGSAPKYIESTKEARGLCPDILRAIEEVEMGLRFRIDPTPTPIKRIEFDLEKGKLDVVCALLDTPFRNEISYRISTPLFNVRERLIGRNDEVLQIHSYKELADTGELVSTQAGASYANMLRSHGVRVDESAGGTPGAFRLLLNKRTRFFYINELTGAYYIKTEGLSDKLRLMPGTLSESPSYLWASRKLDPMIIQRLNGAVLKLYKNGTLNKIYQNYLNEL